MDLCMQLIIRHFNFAFPLQSLAFPLQSKEGKCVAIFRTYIFPYFGIPKIFQTDNGRGFANSIIENLIEFWQSGIQIIHEQPCHPQTQGVIEQAHRTLEQKLATQISSTDTRWTNKLPRVVCKFNLTNTSCIYLMYACLK